MRNVCILLKWKNSTNREATTSGLDLCAPDLLNYWHKTTSPCMFVFCFVLGTSALDAFSELSFFLIFVELYPLLYVAVRANVASDCNIYLFMTVRIAGGKNVCKHE